MVSQFAWLDFSEHERRKALDVIDLFRERDTRDELGIGTVRDALSDVLFPGTSTIQTRARYFLRRTLAVYRAVFGQPRQEDLIQFLTSRFEGAELERVCADLRVDLNPN
jgi:hypothetical protein